jgi:N-acetylglutamate synthase-like GNAT family acetyltransferase
MRNSPLQTIQKLIQERYQGAKTVFWAGSVSKSQGTDTSDLDLVVIYEELANAYREAFIYEEWPVDVFVHDQETLEYFFEQLDKTSLRLSLPNMVAEGIELPKVTELGKKLKNKAQSILNSSPTISSDDLYRRRFHITDLLDDLRTAKNQHEKLATAFELYKQLSEFYLLSNGRWLGSGKQLARSLKAYNPLITQEFFLAFSDLENNDAIVKLVVQILNPHGGLLWDGFKSDAPKAFRSFESEIGPNLILNEPAKPEINKIISAGLKKYNESKIGKYACDPFTIHLKSDDDEIIAGIKGDVFGALIKVHIFWVEEKHRRKGLGTKLMQALEKYALIKSCEIIELNTAEFQAKGFYEKLGFITIATLDNGLLGHTQYIMRKTL